MKNALLTLFLVAVIMSGKPDQTAATQQQGAQPKANAATTLADNDSSAKRPEWWLVLVGILTLLAIAYQAREMTHATKAMQRSAELMEGQTSVLKESVKAAEDNASAAKASAEALIKSERAWVMAEITWTADVPDALRPTKLRLINLSGTEGERVAADICVVCKNDGRTPAWITEEILWFTIVYGAPSEKPDTSRPRSFSYSGPTPLSVKELFTIPAPLECKGRRPQVGGPALLIYGVIKYRDAFGDHETWCGYTITGEPPRLERLAGYPEYNKNT